MAKVADKPLEPQTASSLRYERKFHYANTPVETIIQRVHNNAFGFHEIYYKRKVNNIYFDDGNYNFYKQNVSGVASRKKLRLRWYGDDTCKIEGPTLEVKKKMGEVGDKDSYKLKGISFDLGKQKPHEIQAILLGETKELMSIRHSFETVHPTLLNTYERRYFLSFCGRYRITVDYNQKFYNPNYITYQNSEIRINDTVLELKYATQDDHEARTVSQQIDARLSKNSKYVTGINLLYHPQLL
ncbi:VTC domain-containing protein [Pseudozobellia sp. WGM2]|uniref:VTC domain-containing protein n=1 Tax=Pseudozobellia sp. WGM2 TaxID=2787625 RepID=UPI001ADFE78A|nr:VTC domain-containing protein [Pseudozobellia sp. WGM2]